MKKLLLASALLIAAAPAFAQSSHYVAGHVTKNGTYVAPHYQTNPNSTTLDNWSTKGNVNPYTGEEGTRNPAPKDLYTPPPPPNSYAPPPTTYKPICYYNCPH